MADTDLIMSRPGQVNKSGDIDAMFMKVFSGEVMTAFAETNVMKDLHRIRTIDHGKSASFAVLGKAAARYHVPGTAILGSNKIAANERIINIDDLLIADVSIYDLEDAKNHYDVRQEYSRQLGQALAVAFDKKTMRVAVKAARSNGIIDDEPGGAVINAGANVETDGDTLAEAFFACAQTWDEKDIVQWDRAMLLRPAQYYLLTQFTKALNKDWNGAGSYSSAFIPEIAGIRIIKTNHLPSGVITAESGEKNDYTGDFSNTVALALQKEAIGTVKLKDLTVEKSGSDFHVVYQATMMLAKYAIN